MRMMVYIDPKTYLDFRFDIRGMVASLIAERIRQIIDEYGTNLNISIKKVKHNFCYDEELPFTVINGYVRCFLKDGKRYFYEPNEVIEHLNKNWFDYQIDFEEKEKLNEEKNN